MVLLVGNAMGQIATSTLAAPTNPAPAGAKPTVVRKWSFSASASVYLVPNDRKYMQPTFTADRERLHLEARYNDEALETGSLWAGCNFNTGEKLVFKVTPMVGAVFGNKVGIAPGYKASLGYGKVELTSAGKYVFDLRDRSGNFFYSWSELTVSPLDWFRAGLAAQRTRTYKTDLDIQRGFLVGISYKKMDFAAYVLNAGWTDPTIIFSMGVEF